MTIPSGAGGWGDVTVWCTVWIGERWTPPRGLHGSRLHIFVYRYSWDKALVMVYIGFKGLDGLSHIDIWETT